MNKNCETEEKRVWKRNRSEEDAGKSGWSSRIRKASGIDKETAVGAGKRKEIQIAAVDGSGHLAAAIFGRAGCRTGIYPDSGQQHEQESEYISGISSDIDCLLCGLLRSIGCSINKGKQRYD